MTTQTLQFSVNEIFSQVSNAPASLTVLPAKARDALNITTVEPRTLTKMDITPAQAGHRDFIFELNAGPNNVAVQHAFRFKIVNTQPRLYFRGTEYNLSGGTNNIPLIHPSADFTPGSSRISVNLQCRYAGDILSIQAQFK